MWEGAGMLSDAEQRRLAEMESGLRSADPGFVERFDRVLRHHPRNWDAMTARRWLIVAALIMGLAVLISSVAMVLFALSVAGVGAGLWGTDHNRSLDGRQPPRR
jgi:hypothetical protein